MGGYEVTADSEQPMMFRVCSSAVKSNQWPSSEKSHVGVFDITWIRTPRKSSLSNLTRSLLISACLNPLLQA
ncbi:unnamed protein product [Larinioides sclopetarius]|uniref:Uncharacterized protein n=1 Tax=Larinioides sclopetarius TaxID=280406 RepID=A0AAV2BTN5_9ARAC